MKKIFLFLFFILMFITGEAGPVGAITDPTASPNNRFGIHIINEVDLQDAANLVNTTGGDWGYVTFVIRKDERNIKKWQETFDRIRKLRLIPIVRIATTQTDDVWEKPQLEDINNWVYFLNSLNWVVKNRYVIIGNEPNHAAEWSGGVSPNEYASYLVSFSKQLKNASEDFYVLPAALDASAPTDKQHMEESLFLQKMYEYDSSVFNHIDAWNSHSYPNPNFSASEKNTGRGSVKTYEWELDFLESLGVKRNFQVFITETGWAHDVDGKIKGYKDEDSIANALVYAFQNVWNNEKIVSVTPFILNYIEPPFDIFSWKNKDGEFYNFYFEIAKLPKTKGQPERITSGEIIAVLSPEIIKHDGKFNGIAYVKNTGQTIWEKGEVVVLPEKFSDLEFEPFLFDNIEPGHNGFIFFKGNISSLEPTNIYRGPIKLKRDEKSFGESYQIQIAKESKQEAEKEKGSRIKQILQKILLYISR